MGRKPKQKAPDPNKALAVMALAACLLIAAAFAWLLKTNAPTAWLWACLLAIVLIAIPTYALARK